jgi:zinc protease
MALLIIPVLLWPSAAAHAGTPEEHRFSNGLRIVMQEIPSSQVTCISLFIRAGSIQETEADEGVSRFLEKSLFRVTRNHRDIRTEISSYGGEYVSGVNQDFIYTAVTVGSAFSGPIRSIFEDVILNSEFSDSLVDGVRGDILIRISDERKNPRVQMQSAFLETAFTVHPYRRQPFGSIENFRKFTAADIERYYANNFVPEKIILVVTGRFDRRSIVRSLGQSLGSFGRKAAVQYKWEQEPPRTKPASVVLTHGLKPSLAFVTVGWLAPSITNRETYAMDVVLEALGAGESSRLNREIRSSMPSVYSIWADYRTPREPGYFLIMAVCEPSAADTVRGRVLKEIGILRDDSLTPAELARAKQMVTAMTAYRSEGATDCGFDLGYWSTMAELDFARTYPRRIQAVTSEDVQNTVRTYLKEENSVSVILLPERPR